MFPTMSEQPRTAHAGTSGFLRLSDEVVTLIFHHLGPPDLARTMRTCRHFCSIARSNAIWKDLFFRHFTAPLVDAPIFSSRARLSNRRDNWRELYRVQSNWALGRARKMQLVLDSAPAQVPEEERPKKRRRIAPGSHVAPDAVATDTLKYLLVGQTVFHVPPGTMGKIDVYSLRSSAPSTKQTIDLSKPEPVLALVPDSTTSGPSTRVLAFTSKHLHVVDLAPSISVTTTTLNPLSTQRSATVLSAVYVSSICALLVKTTASVSLALIHVDSAKVLDRFYGFPNVATLALAAHLDDSGRLVVSVAFPRSLYSPPTSPAQHELQVQQFMIPIADGRAASSTALLIPKERAALMTPFTHLPVTTRAPQLHASIVHLSVSAPYIVGTHSDHSVSVFALLPDDKRTDQLVFLTNLIGHTAPVVAVAVQASGRLATLSRDMSVRVWQLEPWIATGNTLGTPPRMIAGPGPENENTWLFHRPPDPLAAPVRRTSSGSTGFAILHLRNTTPLTKSTTRTEYVEEEVSDDEDAEADWRRVPFRRAVETREVLRVRGDACVARLRVDAGDDPVWVHCGKDQVVCGLASRVVVFDFCA
ncbi:hypothetical protein AMAG_12937 [Allomyces macrogynus ATCC 38327]|uniref:F-box domain-containing protein n=1 Tax=Allomyces macrogynus (strain ATCC 38327) TaxID=578462 RepID=A0A0L0T0H2_ALLM3|nr:hypothetical protein AMAG_12937 [Allomyces macrogynus ATCC 38327]|eukprot:KNE68266.1 hypothetical protein AMAG_12937 [Allomyces macrogynus ATCC 38327]